jgi:hypothetical protein
MRIVTYAAEIFYVSQTIMLIQGVKLSMFVCIFVFHSQDKHINKQLKIQNNDVTQSSRTM